MLTMRTPIEAALGMAFSFALLAGRAPPHSPWSSAPPAFVVVVNDHNPITSIDREKLSRIFFKRSAKWPNGALAEPIDLDLKQPSRVAFSQLVHRKTVSAVRAFWQQQIFSGRDVPPAEKASEGDVIAYIRDHEGAVGYVSFGVVLPEGVKAITVEGLGP